MYLLLKILVLLNVSYSTEKPYPRNWCSTGRCSIPQKEIWDDFNNGSSPNWSSMPKVISGSCYHSSNHYNNETEHYSGFIIDLEDDGFSFNGRHSFFKPENPYKYLDLDAARKKFKKQNHNRIEVSENYGFYNANPGDKNPVRYWFKLGEDENLKMAIIFGNLDHFILCDLSNHLTATANQLQLFQNQHVRLHSYNQSSSHHIR